jgi:hypothetical protein
LFVDENHAGVRYLGGFRRSAERARIAHVVYLQRGSLQLGSQRRRPLLTIHTGNWTDDQVATFAKEVGEWVFNDFEQYQAYRKSLRSGASPAKATSAPGRQRS